jgi:hypothetical protein
VIDMTRLILTADASAAGGLQRDRHAHIAIPIEPRLVWGPVPSEAALKESFAPRTTQKPRSHWLDYRYPTRLPASIEQIGANLGLIEFCEQCETVELWIDPVPNAQLILIQLLDFFRSHEKTIAKLTLFQADVVIGNQTPKAFSEWKPPGVKIGNNHLVAASMAWQAYRQPTPQDWFNLLDKDTGALPQLRQTALELLEELPMPSTGLGATEMRLLELISAGNASPPDVFPGYRKSNTRRVFGYWEIGSLLDGLARGPTPAVAGLDEGPFTDELHRDKARFERYKQSKLSLTALGESVLAQTEDFSRNNPIHRWWGGIELRSDNLWRWDAASHALITP